MAIELCSENSSTGTSPARISFSYDLCQSDVVPLEQRLIRSSSSALESESSIDFDFCVRKSFDQESSSADELFSGGIILPVQPKKKIVIDQSKPPLPPPPSLPLDAISTNENLKETKLTSTEAYEKQQHTKSFWRFKRSSSLNCGYGYARSLCPLPLLSRSNSTGSTPNASKDNHNHKQNSQKHPCIAPVKSSQSSSSYQKPPLKKSTYGSYGNGVQINPVLNVPSANLFGLGSMFFNGNKDKNKKK